MRRDIAEGKKCPDGVGLSWDRALQLRHDDVSRSARGRNWRVSDGRKVLSCISKHLICDICHPTLLDDLYTGLLKLTHILIPPDGFRGKGVIFITLQNIDGFLLRW
jgi:hypothetical protein